MTNFSNNKRYLQALSLKQLKAAEKQRLEREVYYPEAIEELEEWYKITVEDHLGNKTVMRLLNRENKRNDSYFVEMNGCKVHWNKSKSLVINATRDPLILGMSEGFRFLAKHFKRIGNFN